LLISGQDATVPFRRERDPPDGPSNDDPRRTPWRRCGSIASCWKSWRASMAGAGVLRVISGQLTASDLPPALRLLIHTDCWFALGVPMFQVVM
jgi:hypothetical protein